MVIPTTCKKINMSWAEKPKLSTLNIVVGLPSNGSRMHGMGYLVWFNTTPFSQLAAQNHEFIHSFHHFIISSFHSKSAQESHNNTHNNSHWFIQTNNQITSVFFSRPDSNVFQSWCRWIKEMVIHQYFEIHFSNFFFLFFMDAWRGSLGRTRSQGHWNELVTI